MAQEAKQVRPRFDSVEEEIEWHKANGSNILVPITKLEANRFYKPVIDEIFLSIEQGDAYLRKDANGNPKYALSFQGLNRLSVCVAVDWDPRETRRVDDGTDKLYVHYQARGGMRKADGSFVSHTASYELDLEIVHEDLEEKYQEKAKKLRKSEAEKQEYIRYCVNRDFKERRRRKVTLAESGAKARVLRSLLGVNSLYTKQELEKPFIVVRYIFQPPENDSAVSQQITALCMGAVSSIYGQPRLVNKPQENDFIDMPPTGQADPDQSAVDQAVSDQAGKEDTSAMSAPDHDPEPPFEPGGPSGPEQPGQQPGQGETSAGNDPMAPDVLDEKQWADATLNEKITEIRRVAAYVSYDLPAFETRAGSKIKDLPEAQLTKLYGNLCGLIEQE